MTPAFRVLPHTHTRGHPAETCFKRCKEQCNHKPYGSLWTAWYSMYVCAYIYIHIYRYIYRIFFLYRHIDIYKYCFISIYVLDYSHILVYKYVDDIIVWKLLEIFSASQLVGAMAAAAPGTGSETLRERITALQASLAANSAALAQTQRQRRKIERQQEQGGLGPVGRQRVLSVYVLSNYNADLAVRAACQYSTVKDPSSPGYPTRTFVEDLFLAASDADLNFIHEDSRRFVAQWETCRWVSSLNAVGVAPMWQAC